ncbi:PD-(D/E)XK motif protein [Xanthobacter autotrophicus DSM 431]|uniref:PD-(D/E)XK motif protein n=1 Tax=Xanthobacter nonsaccharivorans TaxID=3119912 RepID=UPI00372BF67C
MSLSDTQLETLWLRLATAGPGHRAYVSLRIEGVVALDVHAALRASDRSPCLIFDLPNPAAFGDIDFEVGGMRCSRVLLDHGQGLLLSLEDANKRDLFATICLDVIAYAEDTHGASTISAVLSRLEAWRAFLRAIGGGMSRKELIGLIGELQVLRHLLDADAGLLPAWRAPDDALHDFEHLGYALEVKTTLGPGSRVTISGVDQLSDDGLECLDFLHVRLYESAQGETVDDMIERIVAVLPHDEARRQFSNALLRRGLSPFDRRPGGGLKSLVQQITAYRVAEGFPRLLRKDVPPGVTEVTYALDLAYLQSLARPWSETRTAFCLRRT